ncbi:MAG: putative nicotinate-nucleotide pyrophosphorylase [carboxylating] [Elusimicrobia bacterium]|nr:putative nicotinate-nucleotide pyrophosphorylase [carboxylating] [Elusimicrobiota bacterium]
MHFEKLSNRLRTALEEDEAFSDITTQAIPVASSKKIKSVLLSKSRAVVCGTFLANLLFKLLDKNARVYLKKKEGALVKEREVIAIIQCSAAALLGAERTFLNLFCHLSGIATLTRAYVNSVKGTKAQILDTRKTTPLWRDLEKYAVACGGGKNHRFSLKDAALVKDNHLQILRSVQRSTQSVYGNKTKWRHRHSRLSFVAIEAKTIEEVWEAIKVRPDIILLDNMPLNRLKDAIEFIHAAREALKSSKPLIEVSGGITPEKAKQLARMGVNRISVGAITHSAPSMDFSLEVL